MYGFPWPCDSSLARVLSLHILWLLLLASTTHRAWGVEPSALLCRTPWHRGGLGPWGSSGNGGGVSHDAEGN